jgi:hypothetical protein
LQELGYAASQNGSSLEDVGATVTKLSKNIYEAANGNKEMAKSFTKAGIAIRNADGSLRPAADVLSDISDHIAAMPDGTKKTATAIELLGKSGASLIPALNGGSEGLAKYAEEAHSLGGIISNDTVAALDDFGDQQDKVKLALTGLRNDAVVALLPTLKEMVSGLLEWVKANKEIIKAKIEKVIKFIAAGFKLVVKGIGIVIDILGWMNDHLDLVEAAAIAVGAAMLIFKIASTAAAIASGIAWALANLPFILMGVILLGLILIIEDIVTAFQGGRSVIAEFFNKKFGGDFVDTMSRVAGGVQAAFTAVFDFLTAKVNWLIEKGEWLGATLHDLVHGSDQFQSDFQKNTLKQFGLDKVPGGADVFANDLSAIDSFTQAPALPANTANNNGGNSFQAKIEINGANGTPAENATAVTTALEAFWGSQMKKAAAQTGAVK